MTRTTETISWVSRRLRVEIAIGGDAPARVTSLRAAGAPERPSTADPATAQPLVELLASGHGRAWSSSRYVETIVGERLRYVTHTERTEPARGEGTWSVLEIEQVDDVSALRVVTTLRAHESVAGLQAWSTVTNESHDTVRLRAITSLVVGTFPAGDVADVEIHRASTDWLGESRWTTQAVRSQPVVDLSRAHHEHDPRGAYRVTGVGAWSTGESLPTGILVDTATGAAWGWQVEHNGPWHWQVGERTDGLYVAATGPTDDEHQWSRDLVAGESFTSAPASLVVSEDGVHGAFAELTHQRRALRRPHLDVRTLPVVYNDYMNTLMGDPTTEKLLPLVEAAGAVGADYFCIDAGWYADDSDWWDGVGEWQPSTARFSGGLDAVLDAIRAHGMEPGLWLEPEVVGVRSPLAESYPADAFMQRGGRRITEHQRHHLDYSSSAVRAYMDERVDTLVRDHGVRYFKLDYNITPGPGTDGAADGAPAPAAPGDGLLRHNRAYLDWLRGVLDRHPDLILENCASGAMRMDHAMLSELQLQSTSDQQDLLSYPPIAAAAPASLLPEQSASWAYPQPEMSDDELTFTLATAVLGRMYLSGFLDRMTDAQRATVRSAVTAHKALRHDVAQSVPVWPLGLPTWTDPAVCLALEAPGATFVTLWRRPGAAQDLDLPLPGMAGTAAEIVPVFPVDLGAWSLTWDETTGTVRSSVPTEHTDIASARVFKVVPR